MTRLIQLIILSLVMCACSRPADEEQIRLAIEAMAEAVENHRPGDLVEPVAEEFIGPSPSVDRARLRNIARMMMLRNENIQVLITSIEVELVSEDRARVLINALLTGGSGLLPDRGERVEVESTWRKIDGNWLVVRADWDERFAY